MNDNYLMPAIITSICALLTALLGFIIKNNGEIKTLKENKISKQEVSDMIEEKLKIQYEKIDQNIGFISKCIVAIAKELKITTPLE